MQEDWAALFYGTLVLGALVLASFVLWFQLRDRPRWDGLLFALASVATAAVFGARFLLRDFEKTVLGFLNLPILFLYLWFAGLWWARRERAAIYRWGVRHGYRITSLDRSYQMGPGGRGLVAEYRIVARRVSDGQIRIGRVLTGSLSSSGLGFDVLWQGEIPPHHLRPSPRTEGSDSKDP